MPKTLNFNYIPEKEDYLKASRALALKTTYFRIMAVIIFLAILISSIILLVPGLGAGVWGNVALAVLLAGSFFVLYFLVIIPWQLGRVYKTRESLKSPRKITLSDDHLHMQVGDQVTELDWDGFERVIKTSDFYLFIYTHEDRIYPFIPRRAFDDENSEEALQQFLEQKSIPVI